MAQTKNTSSCNEDSFISGKSGGRLIFFVFIIFAVMSSGCKTVAFYQKGHFVDPIMAFDPDPTEVHVSQKIYYSREGSVGGIGASAGGGCGCY